jgi:sugar lactone lactonase YvrE
MTRLLLALAAIAAIAVSAAGAQGSFPSRIELPDEFEPEGIATAGEQFYVGSIPTGAVYRGSLRTGLGALLVEPQPGRAAIGIEVDRGRLFVAGGPTGGAYVYNARTGAPITSYDLPIGTGASFINDVVVTKKAAWFTDSFKPQLYRVPLGPGGRPGPETGVSAVPLRGDYMQAGGFNVNGIDATPNGKTLVFVQSGEGKLFATGANGVAREITLASGESVPMGDGILLDGKTLYVVQNRANMIAKIRLSADLGSGTVLTRIRNADFDVPTTIAEHGSRLYAVNARFEPPVRPTPEYWITQVPKG